LYPGFNGPFSDNKYIVSLHFNKAGLSNEQHKHQVIGKLIDDENTDTDRKAFHPRRD
jgi:hypothetical protein